MRPLIHSGGAKRVKKANWRAFGAVLAVVSIPLAVLAAAPTWWTQLSVIAVGANGQPLVADDFGALNQGQLKQMSVQAFAEFQQQLAIVPGGIGDIQGPSGTGYRLSTLIAGFTSQIGNPASTADDFAVANLGQLKSVVQPFYDRLIELHVLSAYPWTGSSTPADDYAIANLGQLKNVFNFDFTTSTENDGIPNWWKLAYGLNPNDPTVAGSVLNAGGYTNLQAYQLGLDPYTGLSPQASNNPLLQLQVSGFTTP